MSQTDSFYLQHDEPNKACLLALRDLILQQDANVNETVKYGMPCFCFKDKMFCYLWIDKKTKNPYILFVEGKHLNSPLLESGTRSRMKVLHLQANEDLPIDNIIALLQEAINLYRAGIIKTKT